MWPPLPAKKYLCPTRLVQRHNSKPYPAKLLQHGDSTQMFSSTDFNGDFSRWKTKSLKYALDIFEHNSAFAGDLSRFQRRTASADGSVDGFYSLRQAVQKRIRLRMLSGRTPFQRGACRRALRKRHFSDVVSLRGPCLVQGN